MWPLIAAAAAKVAGPLIGGYGNSQDISTGMAGYQNEVNAGTAVLNQGKADATAAYSPYTAAGAQGTSGMLNAIQGRTQAANGDVTDNSSQNAIANYLNPSSAYSIDQSNKAIQAAGIAGGAIWGGMEKALSNNANQMAQTNYNNAYQQMLSDNNTKFGQQNTNAGNTNTYNQQQIGNFGQVAGMGLNATTADQNTQGQYNAAINKNWGDVAANEQSAWNALGKNFKDTSIDTSNAVAGGISSIWGNK